MTFEEVYKGLPEGWLSEGEAKLLWDWATSLPAPVILEVGCYKGRSTCLLAQVPRSTVFSVDPFSGFDSDDLSGERTKSIWHSNIESRGFLNVHQYEIPIEKFQEGSWIFYGPKRVDFAYLDGDHTAEGTRRQIEAALEFEAKVIAIHDVNDSGEGAAIKEVALRLLGPWNVRVERLAIWDRRKV